MKEPKIYDNQIRVWKSYHSSHIIFKVIAIGSDGWCYCETLNGPNKGATFAREINSILLESKLYINIEDELDLL